MKCRWRARLAMRVRMLADRIDPGSALVSSGFRAHLTERGFTVVLGGSSTGLELWYFRDQYDRVDDPPPPLAKTTLRCEMRRDPL